MLLIQLLKLTNIFFELEFILSNTLFEMNRLYDVTIYFFQFGTQLKNNLAHHKILLAVKIRKGFIRCVELTNSLLEGHGHTVLISLKLF